MNKLNLSTKNVKILYIVATVVVILLAYMFGFQRNMAEVSTIEEGNAKLQKQVDYLVSLQTEVTEMEKDASENEEEMNAYLDCFAPKITSEKAIYYIYKMSVASETKVNSIEPGNDISYFVEGKPLAENVAAEADKNKKIGSVDSTERVEINQMVGKRAVYKVGLSGTYEGVMSALDWVKDNDENMSIGATSFTFDASTGQLNGTIEIYFYAMQGNAAVYKAPNLSEFDFGTDNIFGVMMGNATDDNAEDDTTNEDAE